MLLVPRWSKSWHIQAISRAKASISLNNTVAFLFAISKDVFAPDKSPLNEGAVFEKEESKMSNSEAVRPVVIRRVPVSSFDHEDEARQTVPWYSPSKRIS